MFGVVLLLLLAASALAQTATPSVEFGLRVEAAWIGTGDKPAGIPRAMQRSLPDGSAEWQITTDGRSIRSALRGKYLDLPSGIIVLQRDGQDERYVVNPADRTYYARKAEGVPPEETLEDVTVTAANDFATISGFKAQRVVIFFRRPLPAAVKDAGGPSHMQTEIVNWCASDVGLPSSLAAAIDRRVQTFTPRQLADQVAKVCPVAVKSSYRLVTSTPDYAIASTITSIRRLSAPRSLFQLPEGYQKVVPQ